MTIYSPHSLPPSLPPLPFFIYSPSFPQIQEKMSYLEGLHNKVLKLWETKHEDYEEHLDSQKFKEDSEQAEAWIAAQDALLKDDDFGVREREKGREGGRRKEG